MSTPAELGPQRPRSPGHIFIVFSRLALQGFGGVLPIAFHELVEREQWLTPASFNEWVALGQLLPGPNVVNLGWLLGDRWFGWRGAMAAGAGLLSLPLALLVAVFFTIQQALHTPWVAGALAGMGAVAAGLVGATAWKMVRAWPRGRARVRMSALALAAFGAVGLLRWPLLPVMLGLGALGTWLAWREDDAPP